MDAHIALQLLSAESTDLLSVHDVEGLYLFASQSAERFYGWRPDQLVGTSAYDYFHPDDLTRITEQHLNTLKAASPEVRYRLRCANGTHLWVETRSRRWIDEATHLIYIVCVTSRMDWGGQRGDMPPPTTVDGVTEGW